MVESVSGRFSVRLNRVHGISRFPCLAGRPCLLRRGLVAATLCAAMGAGATASLAAFDHLIRSGGATTAGAEPAAVRVAS